MPTTESTQFEKELFHTIESAQTMVVDGVKTFTERVTELRPEDLPEPKAVWTRSFELVEKILENQRKFGLAIMDAATPAEEKEAASV